MCDNEGIFEEIESEREREREREGETQSAQELVASDFFAVT